MNCMRRKRSNFRDPIIAEGKNGSFIGGEAKRDFCDFDSHGGGVYIFIQIHT